MSITINYTLNHTPVMNDNPGSQGLQSQESIQVATYRRWGWLASMFGKAKRVTDDNGNSIYLKKADLYSKVGRKRHHSKHFSNRRTFHRIAIPFGSRFKPSKHITVRTARIMLKAEFRNAVSLESIRTVLTNPWKLGMRESPSSFLGRRNPDIDFSELYIDSLGNNKHLEALTCVDSFLLRR